MSEVVLVHGAWHGAWCWDRVGDELTRAGVWDTNHSAFLTRPKELADLLASYLG